MPNFKPLIFLGEGCRGRGGFAWRLLYILTQLLFVKCNLDKILSSSSISIQNHSFIPNHIHCSWFLQRVVIATSRARGSGTNVRQIVAKSLFSVNQIVQRIFSRYREGREHQRQFSERLFWQVGEAAEAWWRANMCPKKECWTFL